MRKSRFCVHGHDTDVYGRGINYGCKECTRISARILTRKKRLSDLPAFRTQQNAYNKKRRLTSDHLRVYFRGYYQRIKDEFFEQYGDTCQGPTGQGDCIHGGVYDRDILTIAHLNGNGKAHRKAVKGGVLYDLRKRGWPKDEGITVQCFNCQWKHRLLMKPTNAKVC